MDRKKQALLLGEVSAGLTQGIPITTLLKALASSPSLTDEDKALHEKRAADRRLGEQIQAQSQERIDRKEAKRKAKKELKKQKK